MKSKVQENNEKCRESVFGSEKSFSLFYHFLYFFKSVEQYSNSSIKLSQIIIIENCECEGTKVCHFLCICCRLLLIDSLKSYVFDIING